jgi:effector-binding domain-containing protein
MSSVPEAPVVREPAIVTVAQRKAAVVRIEVPAAQLGEAISVAFGDLTAAIAANSLFPIGAPFTHYLASGGEMVVAEVGFRVSGTLVPHGRVVHGELPGGTVATAVHAGPYETIGETYGRLEAWIRDRGHEPGGTMWEVYLRGPGAEPDPANWRTEIYWPLA